MWPSYIIYLFQGRSPILGTTALVVSRPPSLPWQDILLLNELEEQQININITLFLMYNNPILNSYQNTVGNPSQIPILRLIFL